MLVHELGHFWAARKSGIFVEEFAIGMGPKLLATKGGADKTVYSIRAIPIGGFCKMLGEDGDSKDDRAFNNKKIWQRVWVLSAGAFMNFVLAFVLFLVLVVMSGYPTTTIRTLVDGSPAMAGGLQSGDRITGLNGVRINLYEDILFELYTCQGKPIDVRFVRDGQIQTRTLTPFTDANGDFKIGFYPDSRLGLLSDAVEGYSKVGFLDSLHTAFFRILQSIKSTIIGVTRLFTTGLKGAAGPIGIFNMVDETYKTTITQSLMSTVLTMLNLCALLSANLGVINLFPLPAIDGGRLVFLFLESIRRKPIAPEREGMVHFVGFVLLMILAAFIAYQDILKML